ncbi:MAG: tRNA pseudouridine(13) synthase TruD [Myxococcota bacterium]
MTLDMRPYLTGEYPPISGRFRSNPEDFRVDELPAYAPSGSGQHALIHIKKVGLSTGEAVRRVAEAAETNPSQAGYAGLKDKHAVTRQWISLHKPDLQALHNAELEGIEILETKAHSRKLKTGHLRGNRFQLCIRGTPADRDSDVQAILDRLQQKGVPNYFGEQRFGSRGENLERARAWLVEGKRSPRDRFQRKFMVSTLQSAAFNRWLADRMNWNRWGSVVDGDLARKESTGGMFVVEDLTRDLERAAQFDISATGPMFGPRMRWPERVAREHEADLMQDQGLTEEVLGRMARIGPGTRRCERVPLADAALRRAGDESIWVSFTLPAGAYATVVLRELLKQGAAEGHSR